MPRRYAAIRAIALAVVCLSVCSLLVACSTTHYRKSADKETYRAIKEKTAAVPGMDLEFTIEQKPMPPLEDLPQATDTLEFLGEAAQTETGARIVSLEQALNLAVQHNRDYQNEKESLYLEALSLTLDRHMYTPIFSGSLAGTFNRGTKDVTGLTALGQAAQDAPDMVREIGELTGTPGELVAIYTQLVEQAYNTSGGDFNRTRIIEEHSVSGTSAFGIDVLLKGGGRIAVDLTSNFLRFLTGDPRVSATSALAGSITQPLLRGAGRKVAAEQLTQAERDLLYALRDFARFRQEFTVRICTSYYGVLRDRDAVRNNYQSYQSFTKSTERERAYAVEGKRTQAEVGRLEQAQLSNENNWISSIRRYKQSLDQFKLDLGLSANAPIVLDDQEMKNLKEKGIMHPDIASEDAAKVAKTSRLDLYTQRDKLDDAARKLHLAANALKPQLDVVANVIVPTKPENRPQQVDFPRATWSGGLDVGLPFDRKQERNNYRAVLIAQERTKRDVELAEDRVELEVRDAWRNLDQAKRAYEIALKGVELNKRRVEEQTLLSELGRATILNLVDAQNDLTQAENNLTAALIAHTIARLQFWRDMGILFIKENGRWEEVTDVQQP